MQQLRSSADWEASFWIARSRLVEREPAMGVRATGEESLGKRNPQIGHRGQVRPGPKGAERHDQPHLEGPCKHGPRVPQAMIRTVLTQDAEEVRLRPPRAVRKAEINCVEQASGRVHRVVAAVLDIGSRKQAHAHRL